jgi:two-component system chemotaxis sensor kinase CheA
MNGIDEQLSQRIDEILLIGSLDIEGRSPLLAEALKGLFSDLDECLRHPVEHDIRRAALAVSAATPGPSQGAEATFRTALISLRDAIEDKRAQEVAAEQLANDPELVQEFLVEAREHLSGVETGILILEQEPGNTEALNGVFRSFHTIKGLSGFLGAAGIHELAHETENVLDLARAGKLALSAEIIDLILKSADVLNVHLDMARTRPLGKLPRCEPALLAALSSAVTTAASGVVVAAASPISSAKESKTAAPTQSRSEMPLPARVGNPAPDGERSEDSAQPAVRGEAESRVVRIETSKLEYLIDMVGELVIAESVVRHDPAIESSGDPLLSRNLTQLARVVQEVQKTSMSMRMVAVGTIFRKMSRLTRDLARKQGKTIELITVGDEVELDRSIVEDLADPIVHMIRNAVDHGLEAPADRLSAGKAEKGTVRLQAMHDAGDIVIEISDDGRGMDPARILSKARRLGLIGEHDNPDEESIFRLIFEAGFSTAEKVTDMSGRGVGMDVVKKQIQKLRGRIAIRSILGKGSTFVLRLPLTLAIIDGLVVGVGAQRFILPMFAVREMFSPKPETFVTLENRVEAVLFREKLLPLVRLSRLFEAKGEDREQGVLIVVEGRDQLYCIAVDQLIGKQEVVIKSLGKTFRDVPAISGGAILGDGRVGLIVDVNSLRYQS